MKVGPKVDMMVGTLAVGYTPVQGWLARFLCSLDRASTNLAVNRPQVQTYLRREWLVVASNDWPGAPIQVASTIGSEYPVADHDARSFCFRHKEICRQQEAMAHRLLLSVGAHPVDYHHPLSSSLVVCLLVFQEQVPLGQRAAQEHGILVKWR